MKIENHPLCKLIGETVLNVYVGDATIIFQTDNYKNIAFDVEGDCCSQSWFSDIYINTTRYLDKVISIETIDDCDYNVDDGRCRQEYDSVYPIRVVGTAGVCDIYFRNSSNGFYGGWMGEGYNINAPLSNFQRVVKQWHNGVLTTYDNY